MDNLFVLAAHNTVAAPVLAIFVYGLTRVWRSPPVAHVLWLLVLLKLVAPTVVRIDWSARWLAESAPAGGQHVAEVSQIDGQKAGSHARFVDGPGTRTTAQAQAPSTKEQDLAASLQIFWNRARPVLLWFWLGGAILCGLVASARIVRFERRLRGTLPASERLRRLALEISGKLGIRRVPAVRYLECAQVPMLWCVGRPTILLPARLLCQLDDQQAAMILTHELAHLRRRDHWVRAVELIVSTVYWWNPLVWVIRRQIHQAEDLCCDAWVRWAFPDGTRRCAEVVLQTAESLSAPQVGARLLPASPFLSSLSLKARIEMILESRFAPYVSGRSTFAIALLALLVLPSYVETTRTKAWAGPNDQAPATPAGKPDTAASLEFPYVVKFEQGATRFTDGDKITILEIRGTARTFTPGNIYWIQGTYELASHERATLAAYTTAMDSKNGTGYSFNVQTTVVDRGKGTFTLFLPMSCRGWPHVSFYGDGESFGGNYFGTGDSVLKQWWGSKAADKKPTSVPVGLSDVENADCSHIVRFEQGATRFLNGDTITILEVRGTADTFTPGNIYKIKGTYQLASHDRAMLAAYTTAIADYLGRPAQNPDLLRACDKAVSLGGPVFGYALGTQVITGFPVGADAAVSAGGDATYTLLPLDNEIFLDPAFQDANPDPTAASGLATTFNSIRNGAYGYNFQYLGNSRTIDDLGDFPASPYINYPVKPVQDTSRTICFADSRGGKVPHGGHSVTLDPPHQRVHPADAFSTSIAAWGSPSPSLTVGYDPNGPDETGTDIQVYFSPAEERHQGRANVMFLDGHAESHTLQELGYVVDKNGVALPQYVPDIVLNPTPGILPFGNTANASGTTNNISDNHLWIGSGRDEKLSAYFNVQ